MTAIHEKVPALLTLWLITTASGCSSPYFKDRLADLSSVLDVSGTFGPGVERIRGTW